jgi:hypothetical protein
MGVLSIVAATTDLVHCDSPSETVTLQAGALTGFKSGGLLTLAARLPQMSA